MQMGPIFGHLHGQKVEITILFKRSMGKISTEMKTSTFKQLASNFCSAPHRRHCRRRRRRRRRCDDKKETLKKTTKIAQ